MNACASSSVGIQHARAGWLLLGPSQQSADAASRGWAHTLGIPGIYVCESARERQASMHSSAYTRVELATAAHEGMRTYASRMCERHERSRGPTRACALHAVAHVEEPADIDRSDIDIDRSDIDRSDIDINIDMRIRTQARMQRHKHSSTQAHKHKGTKALAVGCVCARTQPPLP